MNSQAYLDFATCLSTNLELSEELIAKGEYKLLHGCFFEAIEKFQKAEELIGNSYPSLYFREGIALFEYGSDKNEEGGEQALLLATKKFKKAHILDPENVEILHAWGNTLTLLGEKEETYHYFLSAKEKYEKAFKLNTPSAELFWDYGIIWYHIGSYSEEAIDLQRALNAFERAVQKEKRLPSEFWVDFGATMLLFATKVKDVGQLLKAVNCFKNAVSIDETCFDSWSSLAESLHMLYEHSHDEDHFSQASDCFAKAASLAPQDSSHWMNWAKFFLTSSRISGDIKRLRLCLEKCHHAYAYDNENALILAIWGEALAFLGQLTERLDLIYEAENKLSEALEINEDEPEVWFSLGMCFYSFGTYFNDADYYYQAIEKFQTGLSINRTCDHLWHAMANTYATVGILEEDTDVVIQSLKFYEKTLYLASSTTRHFDYAKTLSKLGEMTHEQKWLEESLKHFEIALHMQKNAVYLHPEWLFHYATTIDILGDFHDEEIYYTRAIEIFSHVIMLDPDFPHTHHRLAQVFCHLGELSGEIDHFYRAIHHLRFALKHEEDNDLIILDWGIALINIAQHTPNRTEVEKLMQDAEQKITLAAKLGNIHAYYYLSCLYSLSYQYEKAMYFLMKTAQFDALPPPEELLNDEWLDDLRSTSAFQEFLTEHPHLFEEK